MNQPNRLIVEAIIPSLDNPDAHVLDKKGLYPVEVVQITESIESTLHSIGQTALAQGYLSVDQVLSRKTVPEHPYSNESVNKASLLTKPLDRSQIALADNYEWSDNK